jgi:diguanylate cyclase (GGDEF)-like protein/PAS domain S-box-containing protein
MLQKRLDFLSDEVKILIMAVMLMILSFTLDIDYIDPFLILFVIYSSLKFAKKGAVYSAIFAILVLTIQQLMSLEMELIEYFVEAAAIITAAAYIILSTARIEKLNDQLKERVKELAGLYNISKVVERSSFTVEEAINKILNEIPLAYQYPADVCVQLSYKGENYQTDNFKKTEWKLKHDIVIDQEVRGSIELYYLSEHPIIYNDSPFLKEEHKLLNSTAGSISGIIKNIEQEKENREQKEFLSITLDSIGDGVIVTDESGAVKRMNKAAEALTGWDSESAAGVRLEEAFNIINFKTKQSVENPVQKVIENGKTVGLANHTVLISKNGERHHIADSAAPIKDENGVIYGVVMVFRDITDKYKMRRKIKRREKMFSKAVNEAPYPIMVHAENGEVIELNKAWTEITGYARDEIETLSDWTKRAYREKSEEMEQYICNLYDKKERRKNGEFTVQTKDGEKRIWDFSSAPLGVDENGEELLLSIAVDISKRKEMESEIEKLNRIYKTLSMVNQLIVREKNLPPLAEAAVELTVKHGSYNSAWIGRYNEEENQLEILAEAGMKCEFIADAKYGRLDLHEEKYNIFKHSLREEENTIINGIADSELFASEEHRCCSSLALFVLEIFDRPWGIFAICSDKKNHFDDMEAQLLGELSSDIGLGIEKIENEKRRLISERKLRRSENNYKNLFQKSPVGIFQSTSRGKFKMLNPHLIKMLGFDNAETAIEHYNKLADNLYVDPEKRSVFIKEIREKNTVNNFVFKAFNKNNDVLWLEMNARISRSFTNGQFIIDGFVKNISDRKEIEEKLRYNGFHDKLTGLYNRAFLEAELQRIDTKRQLPISIIMGDLNNLKLINDSYGHFKGDELIKEAADIINESCRSEDILARWGGDEFVILLPKTELEVSEEIIERIYRKSEERNSALGVSISLGTAAKTSQEEDIFKVLSRAEDRMYKNKISNRKSARSSVLSAFLTSLRAKSSETEEHVGRMSKIAGRFGQQVGLSSSDLDKLYLLTQMHDIGKIAVPEEILNKSDKLTDDEWEKIKKHTEVGYRITSNIEDFAHIAAEILYHHEWWDGSGYPEGLVGEEIPLLSRILAVVDAYDVMISGRPYKKAMTKNEAAAELKKCAGSQFDPELVDLFLEGI